MARAAGGRFLESSVITVKRAVIMIMIVERGQQKLGKYYFPKLQ